MNPKDLLPTREDLRKLSLRAVVAFAARCGRRVQPLYQLASDLPDALEYTTSVGHALSLAEDVARGKTQDDPNVFIAVIVKAKAAIAPYTFVDSQIVADVAAEAAKAAFAVSTNDGDNGRKFAYEAAFISVNAASDADNGDDAMSEVAAAARADFQRLIEIERGSESKLGNQIDMSDDGPLGSLWPNGEPKWYERMANAIKER